MYPSSSHNFHNMVNLISQLHNIVKCLFFFFYFTILYWFCHTSKSIRHRYTHAPHPEPSSLPIPSLWVVCTYLKFSKTPNYLCISMFSFSWLNIGYLKISFIFFSLWRLQKFVYFINLSKESVFFHCFISHL